MSTPPPKAFWISAIKLLVMAALAAGSVLGTLAAEQFVLQVPGQPNLTSTVRTSGQQLVITDAQNQSFVYQRQPQFDSPDRQFLGYYSPAAQQALRWPANNAGSMLIGDAQGQNWRRSQQQIQGRDIPPQGRPPLNRPPVDGRNRVTARRPIMPADPTRDPGNFREAPQAGQQQQQLAGPMEVAFAPAGNEALHVGYVDRTGKLQVYRGWRDTWRPQEFSTQEKFLPGAPLALVSRAGEPLPAAYTVNSGGKLVEIQSGRAIRPVAENLQFAERSHFEVNATPHGEEGFAVDSQGRLWQLDLTGGQHQLIDQNPGRFSPGVPVSVVSRTLERGQQRDLFLVDRSGQVLNYSSASPWTGPHRVAAGFPPGAPIAAGAFAQGGVPRLNLAGVDARGRLQWLGQTQVGWSASPIQGATLPPGSPVALSPYQNGFGISAIGSGGVWNHWRHAPGGQWNHHEVSRGFLAGSPIAVDPFSHVGFGIDATQRLVAGGYWNDDWHSYLLLPGIDFTPRLVNRRIVGNQQLNPATVFFDNRSQEELVVQMVDQFSPLAPAQFNVPPGGSVPRTIRRDGGGTLEEVYLVPGPFGDWVERVESYPLPPQPGPTVVVWAKRVTYSYVDPKNISVLPDFDLKNNVSLGTFDLPPGEFLRDGERIDVYREAVARRNPGAARWFGPPVPDPDVGVRLYTEDDPRRREDPATRPPSPPLIQNNAPPNNPPLPPEPEPAPQPPPASPNDPEEGPALPPLPD